MKSATQQPYSRRELTLAVRLLVILFTPMLLLLTGCQEDDRAAHSTTWRASELANNRLGTAAGGLLKTLGQEDRAEKPVAQSKPRKNLSWSAPETREDGSPLEPEHIAGFRIYYRLQHTDHFSVIGVDSPGRTSHPLTDLPPGVYEFTITAVDAEGLESRRSEPVLADLI